MLQLLDDGETPRGFAISLMRDEEQPLNVRLEAARIAAPYVHPRPQPEGRLVNFTLPEDLASTVALAQVHTTILQAVATSQLSVDEAKDIAAMLETHRRSIETAELEARIAKLEKTLGGQS